MAGEARERRMGPQDAPGAGGPADEDYATMTLPESLLGDADLAPAPHAYEAAHVDEDALGTTAAALRRTAEDAGRRLGAHCAEIERIIAGTPLPFMHEHMMSYVDLMRRRYDTALARTEHAASTLEDFAASTRNTDATGARRMAEPREDLSGL